MSIPGAIINALLVLLSAAAVFPLEAADRGPLMLETPRARYSFGGEVGRRIERDIDGWLLPAPIANPGMIEMFRVRDRQPKPQLVDWAGEFAGKYLLSAVLAMRQTERPDLRARLDWFVGELLSTQAEDGYLGPFPREERLRGHWDLWGHYHVLQALLAWNEETGDERALAAATRAADLMCRLHLDGGRRVLEAGSPEMNMAVSHVLGALHRRTASTNPGNERYLRLLREIEADWEKAGDYLRAGLAGLDFYRTPRPRWESLHDIQALVELYRITGDERYRRAFTSLWRSIARLDRHNTGGFSSGEQAVGHPYSPAAIETCCTVAWMALSLDMLRLTGETAAADELELSTLNGLLGAQHPSGRWWTYNTPMDGAREASAHSIVFQSRAGTPELNCCSVNGPRGLGMLAEWAVLAGGSAVYLSYYGPFKSSVDLPGGGRLDLQVESRYPADLSSIRITLSPDRPRRFDLRLRIPGWSRETRLSTPDGPRGDAMAGRWLSIEREWKPGDALELSLDPRLRIWPGDRECAGRVSLFRGPLLLAYDQRWNPFDEQSIPPLDAQALAGAEARALSGAAGGPPGAESPFPTLLLVDVPAAGGGTLRLSDFASAGSTGTRYRSWLPVLRLPPPPVLLEEPPDGAVLAPGSIRFVWDRRRRVRAGPEFTLTVSAEQGGAPVFQMATRDGRAALPRPLPAGDRFFWKVEARNEHGTAESEVRSFRIDPALPPGPPPPPVVAGPGRDGILVVSTLHGVPGTAYGALLDARGWQPAPGRDGKPAAAVELDGVEGRIRYALPYFPERDWTAAVWVLPRAFPAGRIAQVMSAWAGPMDDPLRLTIEGGKLHARIEAGTGYSTPGAALEAGRWVHAAAVKANGRLTLYVGGEPKGEVPVPQEIVSQAEVIALGGNPLYPGNEHLPAVLSGFVLYDRALTPQELRKLAE